MVETSRPLPVADEGRRGSGRGQQDMSESEIDAGSRNPCSAERNEYDF